MIKNWKYILAVATSLSVSTAFSQTVNDAQRATELGKYEEATKTLTTLNNGNNPEAALYLGDVYIKTGKKNAAVDVYMKAYNADPKSSYSLVAAGKASLLKGNMSEAEDHFDKAIRAAKRKDPEVYRLIGQAYADAEVKDITKALEYLEKGNEITDFKSAPMYLTLGDLHLNKADNSGGGDAMNAYDRAVQLDKNNAKAHFRRGRLFVRSRNFNEAQEALQAAIAADPNYAPAYRELGEMYYFTGKYDQAMENYKKFMSLAENNVENRAVNASFLFLNKDYANALKEAQEVLKQDPNHVVMNRLLAFSLYETGQNEKALAAMENYFKVADPAKVIGSDYAYYGRMLAKAGKPDLAQANLDKATAADPNNTELLDDVANFYIGQKNYPKAIAAYKAKIAAKPNPIDEVKLADAYIANKQFSAADTIYLNIIKIAPTYTTAYYKRAEIANAQDTKQTGAAKPFFEEYIKQANEAIAKDPTKAETYKPYLYNAYANLGVYAYNSKNYEEALKQWTEAKRINPTDPNIDNYIKNAEQQLKLKK